MIIYNIRKNGPYEYDKFILNIFQLYNLIYDEKKNFGAHEIHNQLNSLNTYIKDTTNEESNLNKLIAIYRAVNNK